ncbi:hypothetical protein [Streptomyces sp. NPDC093594]|uniref:hypothetical protein n=1 Tax=Streptomyces sp. NPDC093594 TaxID=3155305 RepID=UPI00344FBB22
MDRRDNSRIAWMKNILIAGGDMRQIFKFGSAVATAAIAFGAMTGVSYADTYTKGCNPAGEGGGQVNCWTNWYNGAGESVARAGFDAFGEILHADDTKTDGRGVYVYASWSGGSAELWNSGGAGTYERKNLDIAEGKSVSLTMCQTDNGALLNCAYATAMA